MERLILILMILAVALGLICWVLQRFARPVSVQTSSKLSKVIVWLVLLLIIGRIIKEFLG